MAFTNTVVYKGTQAGGIVVEKGTWTLSGGSTSGTITTNKLPTDGASIGEIESFSFSNDNDHGVFPAQDGIGSDQIKITTTANDTGSYCLVGKAV